MAYTEVDPEAAAAILKSAGCAPLSAVQSISGGWANSNYLLELEDGERLSKFFGLLTQFNRGVTLN